MEFLFTDKGASIEALLLLLCLSIILLIYAYDGYVFLRRFYTIFIKNKISHQEAITSDSTQTVPTTSTVIDTTVSPPPDKEEDKLPDEGDSTHPIEDDTPITAPQETTETIDEEEIYAEYVALVDETHAEKEKEEAKIEEMPEEEEEEEEIEDDQNVPENIFDTPEKEDESLESIVSDSGEIPDETASQEIESEAEVDKNDETNEEVPGEEEIITQDENSEIPSLDEAREESSEEVHNDEGAITSEEKTIEQDEPPKKDSKIWDASPKDAPIEQNPAPVKNHSETLFTLVNTIRTVMARGQMTEARVLIIQGLALDKGHRDLNLMLGSLYEGERHFEKAEYVYKDLAIDHPDDIEILEKLGNVLIIEKRYSIALEIYKKILTLGGETEGTLYILSHLCHEMNDANEGYLYMKKYLKSWPNNPEILALMSEVEIELNKRKDAIETLKRLKNLTPYNSEITATLHKLMMEEELAGNFGGEQ